jgi:hypothetical protein
METPEIRTMERMITLPHVAGRRALIEVVVTRVPA